MEQVIPDNATILLDLIRSEQMTHQQIENLLEDHPDFAIWYRRLITEGTNPCI